MKKQLSKILSSSRKRGSIIALLLVLVSAVFFSFFHLEKLYGFEFDQERDYYIVKSIVVDQKLTLIGPRVVSSSGFYLGPWYYYLQVPFFIAMNGSPLYGAVFTGFINCLICLSIYLVLRYHTKSRLIPIFAAILWVSTVNRSNWNVQFVPLFFLIFLHLYWQYQKTHKFNNLWLLTLTFSFSLNFHPQMIFLTPLLLHAYFVFVKNQKRIHLGNYINLFLALALPFLPLVFFDLRHNFINLNALMNFVGSSAQSNQAVSGFRFLYSVRQFSTSLMAIYPGFQHQLLLTGVFILAVLLFTLKFRRYFPMFLIAVISILSLSFYRQLTWPEYYHFLGGFSLFMIVFFAAAKIQLLKIPLVILLLTVIWGNYRFVSTFINPGSYYYKRQVIQYMLSENKPYEKLNITNVFPYGEGLGFQPIREFYESKTGEYNPHLKFFVAYVSNPKQNQTKKDFGLFAVSKFSE